MAQTTQPNQTASPNQSVSVPPAPGLPTDSRDVSWRKIIPNIIKDQPSIWLSPAKTFQDKHWIPVVAFLGATAALIAVDPTEAHYFRNTSTYTGFNKVFSSNNTAIFTAIAPLSLYGAGLIRRDSKMQKTALFAGEAVADAEIVTSVFKAVDKRLRPVNISRNGMFSDSWTDSPSFTNGSFPSGHSIAAFSVATVVARRYRTHKWVPYTAYGLATLVAFSRLTLSAHYLSDVAVGGVFGYAISRYVVLQQ